MWNIFFYLKNKNYKYILGIEKVYKLDKNVIMLFI